MKEYGIKLKVKREFVNKNGNLIQKDTIIEVEDPLNNFYRRRVSEGDVAIFEKPLGKKVLKQKNKETKE